MSETVEQLLEKMRERFGARNDKELADHIGVHKSTISTWKRRGSIPDEHLTLLQKSSNPTVQSAPVTWGTWHWYCFGLALMRFTYAAQPLTERKDYQELVGTFRASNAFFAIMGRAEGQLNIARMRGDYSLETAFAMAVAEYLSDQESFVQKDRDALRELGFIVGE